MDKNYSYLFNFENLDDQSHISLPITAIYSADKMY